jgi:hypothetical protein
MEADADCWQISKLSEQQYQARKNLKNDMAE